MCSSDGSTHIPIFPFLSGTSTITIISLLPAWNLWRHVYGEALGANMNLETAYVGVICIYFKIWRSSSLPSTSPVLHYRFFRLSCLRRHYSRWRKHFELSEADNVERQQHYSYVWLIPLWLSHNSDNRQAAAGPPKFQTLLRSVVYQVLSHNGQWKWSQNRVLSSGCRRR